MIFVYQNKTKYLLQDWIVYSSSPFPTTKAVWNRDDLYIPPQPKKGYTSLQKQKVQKNWGTTDTMLTLSKCDNPSSKQ